MWSGGFGELYVLQADAQHQEGGSSRKSRVPKKRNHATKARTLFVPSTGKTLVEAAEADRRTAYIPAGSREIRDVRGRPLFTGSN